MVPQINCKIIGRVQMVMYRDFACRNARKLGLKGFVRNEPDGSVSVIAQGERALLEQLIERLREGPMLANVENVEVEWGEAKAVYENFDIEY
jgi:acylphosphatase